MLEVRLFGQMRACVDGASIDPPSRRDTERLWVYLLLHRNDSHDRGELAQKLYGDSEDARARLRFHLHDLVKHLPATEKGGEWISADRTSIRWNRDAPCWIDVAEFERLSSDDELVQGPEQVQRLQSAADLYSGELLEGATEPWVLEARGALASDYITLLHRLAEAHRAVGEASHALESARKALNQDPLRETSHRLVMRLLYETGDRAAALRQYDALVDELERSLGEPPALETRALAEQVRSGTVGTGAATALEPDAAHGDLASDAPVAASQSHGGALPVYESTEVGSWRATDLSKYVIDHRLTTVTGPPGCGKSRMAVSCVASTCVSGSHSLSSGSYVDLWGVLDGPSAASRISSALRTLTSMDASPRDVALAAAASLGDGDRALILDNADGCIPWCCEFIAWLLRATATLRVIVTSRERLRLDGEALWVVPLLSTAQPARAEKDDFGSEAEELFVSRAHQYHAGWALTDERRSQIGFLCRSLDGLPMALEHAAAFAASRSLDQLWDKVDAVLLALDEVSDVGESRHASVRQALTWSTDRLTGPQRALLQRLAEHDGAPSAADLKAAPIDDRGDQRLGADDSSLETFDALADLIAKSLVTVEIDKDAMSSYHMLAIVRQACMDARNADIDHLK